jgi:hypothetical protein
VSTYTDPVGHGVDQQFRLRQLEQQAVDDSPTTSNDDTTGR